ncbi:ABC-3 protein [Flammeovirgaceae bacterium 311]|nr:ABC-3 protein [Flammeovirgaceae bacterium 311]
MLDFNDPNLRYVILGSLLLAGSSAVVGCFTFLRKKALVGDAVAHAVLPGICLGFILSGTKNPLYLVAGAFVTGWLSVVALDYITRNSKIKEDTATGLVLSVFFGIGIFLLTMVQNSGNAAQSGLNNFLFGKAASLLPQDILVFGIISLILIFTVLAFYKELKIITFDPAFARSSGIGVAGVDLMLTSLTVLAVVVGIQAVGVVLMAAMLITPAAAARFWTDRLSIMLLLAAVFGIISGFAGTWISLLAPSMPTGPWMVIVLSTIALTSFFIAPGKGILQRLLKQHRFRRKIQDENFLKTLYNMGVNGNISNANNLSERVLIARGYQPKELKVLLKRMYRLGYLEKTGTNYRLNTAGLKRGQRVVKLHRLWEVYLTQYVQLATDHVHDDAESIEHLLTPELEKLLEEKLNYPPLDPHSNIIPYQKP